MLKTMHAAVVVFLLFCATASAVEKKFGVAVYPGAHYDAVTTKLSKFTPNSDEAAYRTSDGIRAVVEFYRKQGLVMLRMGGESKTHARFKDLRHNVDVIVQNPWKDPQTKAEMHDTLILIFKVVEE